MFHFFLNRITTISSFSWISVFDESDPLINSVLEVTKDDYDKCYVSNPIKEHTDVNTKVELDRSGPFYFISNAVVSCEKGQKLTVVVLHKHPKPPPPPGHASSPAPLSQPLTAGAFGLRGGFFGFVVGILSLVRIFFIWGTCVKRRRMWTCTFIMSLSCVNAADCRREMWTWTLEIWKDYQFIMM